MLTSDEKGFLKDMVKRALKDIQAKKSTIKDYPFPRFLAAEKRYEDFLKGIIGKLK